MQRRLAVLAALLTVSCGSSGGSPSESYTLYRNSNLDENRRLHWASFDAAGESGWDNVTNCEMAARLLNEHFRSLDRRAHRDVQFWCEPGPYVSHL
jgi:hypothetical protein